MAFECNINDQNNHVDTISCKVMEERTHSSPGKKQGGEPEVLSNEKPPDDLIKTMDGFTDDPKLSKKLRNERLKMLLDNIRRSSKTDSETISSANKRGTGGKIADKSDTLKNGGSVAEGRTGNERSTDVGNNSIILIDDNDDEPTDIMKANKYAIARRKSPREKRNVICYSPGRADQNNQKKIKLGIQKGGKPKPQDSVKWDKGFCQNNEGVSLEVKGTTSNAKISPKSDKKDGESEEDLVRKDFSSDFKLRMTEEIKKQVLGGLGDVAKAALQDFHVVEIEEMQKCSTAVNTCSTEGVAMKDLENTVLQHYVAKVKLTATLLIPLTVQVAQEPQGPQEQQELPKPEEPKKPEEPQEPQEPQDVFEEVSHGLPPKYCDDEAALFDVANFEYYDFDRDRSDDKFAEGQIWALYDDKDGMPRYYVQISKILTKCPFQVQIAWLQPKAYTVEACAWANSGNSLTCGEYDISEQGTLNHVECFSHVMKPETGQEGRISIYPAKGDVWALYKGWNERVNCEYEIVQVLATKAASSVSVVPLVKAKGYRTLFIQRAFLQKPQQIPMQEITRFSHQIPVYKLDMEEVPDVLKDCSEFCLELDPASTPLCLIDDK